jgi:phytoene dehydrogenase-like protein
MFNLKRMDRRVFLKMSALWSTAAALGMNAVPASAYAGRHKDEYDAAVIGAGLGGLAFAGYMAKNGFRVLVLDRHNVPGGYATTFTRDRGRFTFEVSLHQMAVSGVTQQILEDLEVLKRVRFVKSHQLFRLVSPGVDISCPGGDPEAFEKVLIEKYPQERKGINGFVTEMLGLNEEVERLFKQGKLNAVDKVTFPLRYPKMWGARHKSLADYVNQYTSNAQLKSTLSVFGGYYGLPPSRLSGFYYLNATGGYLRHGGSYPYGGSQSISNALVSFIESKGGEVALDTEVKEVLIDDGAVRGVKISDGKTVMCRAVAANCSAVELFTRMIPPKKVPEEFRSRLGSLKPSISTFVVWLALNKDITGQLRDSHISLQAQPDGEKAFEYGLQAQADKCDLGVCVYNNIYKDYSPPGTTVLTIVFTCGFEPWKAFEQDYWADRKTEYLAKKNQIAQTIIRRVERELLPGLSDMIAVQEAATPLTNRRYTLNTNGAIYGFEQSLDNAFMNRISNRLPVKGLYLAGAWGEPGGGYSGVLISGKKTFGMLMEDWGKA